MEHNQIARKLSDAKEAFKWYSLQIPELASLQPRVGHALVSLNAGKVLMLGGGNHSGALNEVVSINLEPGDNEGVVSKHPASQSFPARYEFLCAKDRRQNCAWIFGGADTENSSNEIIRIDESAIETVKLGEEESKDGGSPCPRTQGSSSALVEYTGKSYVAVFAGGLKGEQPVEDQDLYLFDTTERKWQKISVKMNESLKDLPFSSQPPLVQGHAMTAIGSKILVHGGICNTTLYDGYHWLDLEKENEDSTRSWINGCLTDSCPDKPPGRAAHGIARISDVDANSTLFYVFGGIGEKGALNDLWSFNVDSSSWMQRVKSQGKTASGLHPVPRLDFAMCAVGLNNANGALLTYILLNGGMNRDGEIFNDTWIMRVQ